MKLYTWRGVDVPCRACGGAGARVYPSGSTWRGGMGAAAMTRGVCDVCWGSGEEGHPWENLREARDTMLAQVEQRARELLARSVGADIASIRPAILEVCKVLDREARRRKPPTGVDFWGRRNWELVTEGLASALRRMVKERENAGR